MSTTNRRTRGLTRERILTGALDLLDREGLDAFSMRRLAQELGVGTMTIYGYYRSRDEILDAVVDVGGEAIAEVATFGNAGGPWKPRLRELMLSLYRRQREHPGIVELRYKRPLLSPGALKITEAALRILRDAGFDKREAASAYRVLFIYSFGFAAFGPGRRSAADREQTAAALRALPAQSYPTLVDAAAEAAAAMADEDLFELGLDAVLDGFERTLASGR